MFKRIFFSVVLTAAFCGLSYGQLVITSSGVNNNFSVTYPANLSVLPTGLEITFFANHTISTGGVTLNVNGLGALPIVKNVNQPLSAGEITTNQAVKVVYSTLNNWQMVSAPPSSSQDWTMLGNTPDSNSNYLGTNNLQPLLFYTNGVERMRISRQGRFGFNMNVSSGALMNIKSQGTGPTISIFRSSDSNPIMEFRESGGGNARIDLYNGGNLNTVQIPSGNGDVFFAGGGNFGIGTTSPGNNLHVIGGGRFTNLSSSGISFVQADNLGNLQITTNTGFLGGTGIQNQLAFFSSANTLTSTGNMFYTPASSSLSLGVISLANGFGSFAIGSNVSVSGPRSLGIGNFINITNLGNVALGDWSSSTPSILTSGSDDQFLARFANGYHLYTRSNLSDGVFINSLGQGGLGIGSSSATHRLNVSATIIAGAENLARFVVPDATGNYLDVLNGNPTAGTFLPKIQSYTVGLSSGLVLESLQNNDVSSHPSLIVVNSGFTSPTNPFVARQLFEIQNGSQLRLRVSSDGTTRIASLTSTGNNYVQANSLGDLFISTNTGSAPFWALGGNTVSSVRTIGTSNNFELPIITNNVERMRILNNGYLRIGDIATAITAGPKRFVVSYDGQTNLMHFLPNANATTDGFNLGGLTFSDAQAPTFDQALIIAERDGVSTSASDLPTRITFSTTPAGSAISAERMRINAAGDVGIGVQSPTSRLHVYDINTTLDGIGGTFIDVSNHTNTNNIMSGIRFRNTSTDVSSYKGALFFKRNDGLAFGRGDIILANRATGDYNPANLTDAKLTIRSNGQILLNTTATGITDELVLGNGTGSPTFAINGGNSTTGAAFGVAFYSNGGYRASFGYSPVAGQDYVFLYEGGVNSFVSKGGLIGINTQTPAANLDVNGSFVLGTNGTVLTEVIRANVVFDIPSVNANSGTTVNLAVPGATVGSTAYVSPSGSFSLLIGSVYVNVANNVQMLVYNPTGLAINPASMTYYVTVIR